jgi:maleylacetate reductase
VAQHAPTRLADEAAYHSTQLGAEVLLAIGGGSATGLAKAVALRTGLPILAVPAICGQ